MQRRIPEWKQTLPPSRESGSTVPDPLPAGAGNGADGRQTVSYPGFNRGVWCFLPAGWGR